MGAKAMEVYMDLPSLLSLFFFFISAMKAEQTMFCLKYILHANFSSHGLLFSFCGGGGGGGGSVICLYPCWQRFRS
jgi:hypothetical protein